jgi:hypothetical protein
VDALYGALLSGGVTLFDESLKTTENNMPEEKNSADVDSGRPVTPTVDWDDSNMRSSYANVVNASSTREEVTLFFGTNKTWKLNAAREFHVELNDRIVLNPYAAKRLWVLLGALLKEYETRFGELKMDVGGPQGLAKAE